jgi:flagellar hook-length control protein FliK
MSSVVATPALPPAKSPLAPASSTSTDPAASTAPSFGSALQKASSDASQAGAASTEQQASATTPAATPPSTGLLAGTQAPASAHGPGHAKGGSKKDADAAAGARADATDGLPEAGPMPVVPSVALSSTGAGSSDGATPFGGKPAAPVAPVTPDQGIAAAMLALISGMPRPASIAPVALPAGSTGNDLADGSTAGVSAMSSAAPTLTDTLSNALEDVVSGAADAISGSAAATAAETVAAPVADLLGKGAEVALSALTGARPSADPASQALLTANAQNASQLASAHLAQTGNLPPTQLQSTQVAGTQAFAQELGNQIAWMGNADIKQASIRLHPEDLGQVDVKVSLQHGRVDVAFAAQHPAAVTAVQQTLSQLDTMLAHHGLSLGQAQVSQQEAGQGGGNSAQQGHAGGNDSGANDDTSTLSTVRVSQGLVDDFA